MYVIFIHGPVAAGKHTIGALLAERMAVPLFHNHLAVDLVKPLFDFGSEAFIALREEIWLAAFSAAAREGRPFIFTFNPEATVDPGLIGKLQTIVEDAGGRVHYVALTCSGATVLERLGNESRAKFGKLLDAAIYQEINAGGGFDFPPLPRPVITVDTEIMAPEDAAAAIQEALARAG